MLETVLDVLKNSAADDYEVTQSVTTGWEFYFIRHDLDQNRAKKVEHIRVKVYKKVDDGRFLGFASGEVPVDSSEEEIKKYIDGLIYQASLVKNRPYELCAPKDAEAIDVSVPEAKEDAARFLKTFASVEETESEYLNSYEIFYNITRRRFITSRGIDITEVYPSSALDVVVNAKNEEHEIELYRYYTLGSCDEEYIRGEIEDTLRYGRDRLVTKPTPKLGECPVLFSTDAAIEIYNYFLDNLDTAYVYRKMSSFEPGKPISEDIRGDKVTLEARRVLPNSSENFAYDRDGAPIRDLVLMKDSIPEAYWGSRMFSQYMGLEDSFSVSNWVISGGTKSEEELRSGTYLEIVEFSDFQVDSITGDIFGEIRLAYYHDGDTITPVSGGSVSGDLKEALKEMHMSVNTRRYNNVEIPSVTRLEKVTVTGIE